MSTTRVTATIGAPRDAVYRAFTDPAFLLMADGSRALAELAGIAGLQGGVSRPCKALEGLDAARRDALMALDIARARAVTLGVDSLRRRLPSTGSTTGSMGTAAFSVYSASKAAVRNFARSWILELKDRGIRVNCIHPGLTTSAMSARLTGSPTVAERLANANPLGRLGQGDDTAALAEFLLSAAASWITGQQIGVDGGQGRLLVPPKS